MVQQEQHHVAPGGVAVIAKHLFGLPRKTLANSRFNPHRSRTKARTGMGWGERNL